MKIKRQSIFNIHFGLRLANGDLRDTDPADVLKINKHLSKVKHRCIRYMKTHIKKTNVTIIKKCYCCLLYMKIHLICVLGLLRLSKRREYEIFVG